MPRLLYQVVAAPAAPVETLTLDKWWRPWLDPVRLVPNATRLVAAPPLAPTEIVSLDKWYRAWGEPGRSTTRAPEAPMMPPPLASPPWKR